MVVRLLKCYIHTDRPSDEPGCRGAFAPKNSRTCRVLSPNLHRGFLHNFRKPARLFVCSSTVRPRRGTNKQTCRLPEVMQKTPV